jgi:hypothetical protein
MISKARKSGWCGREEPEGSELSNSLALEMFRARREGGITIQ